jgi:hypothetical protein
VGASVVEQKSMAVFTARDSRLCCPESWTSVPPGNDGLGWAGKTVADGQAKVQQITAKAKEGGQLSSVTLPFPQNRAKWNETLSVAAEDRTSISCIFDWLLAVRRTDIRCSVAQAREYSLSLAEFNRYPHQSLHLYSLRRFKSRTFHILCHHVPRTLHLHLHTLTVMAM